MSIGSISRRDFMKTGAVALAAGAVASALPAETLALPSKKSRVILIRHKDLLDELNKPNPAIVREMLDTAVSSLFETADAAKAWKNIAGPKDIVGVKSNGWRNLATPPELEAAIRARLEAGGVPKDNISIRDRGVLTDEVFRKATVLINARPMRTHHWAGLGSCIKNYILFVEKPPDYHPDSCADLAAVWKLPQVAGRTRLNILVMFTPLFHGVGPHHFNPEYTWRYNGLIVGADPVAVDATGMRIIAAKRREHFGEDRPINPPPKHIELADTRHGIGTADPAKIELVTLGWKEGLLL
jgi:hypothetical protein